MIQYTIIAYRTTLVKTFTPYKYSILRIFCVLNKKADMKIKKFYNYHSVSIA